VIDTSGTIEFVWAEVDIEVAEGSSCCSRVEEERTMFRPMRVLSEDTYWWWSFKMNGRLVEESGRTLILGIFYCDLSLILLPSNLSVRCFILVLVKFLAAV